MYDYSNQKTGNEIDELFRETILNIRRLRFRPQPSFGQNFVVSQRLVDEMIKHAKLSDGDRILEIGGGMGTLTQKIVDSKASEVFVVEADKLLERFLQLRFYNDRRVYIIGGDFLNLNLEHINFNKVVSNPPFHISTQIIKRLSKLDVDLAVMTFQKDFVNKMIAPAGSKYYSKISVFSKVLFEVEVIEEFPRDCFYPAPKIDISLVTLKPRKTDLVNTTSFWEFLTCLFNNRNRKFVKAIENFVPREEDMRTLEVLKGIKDRRVFQISPEDIFKTFKLFAN
jgi:16S rRNA (adenine1518-N6/adenine1519-N6)-dimethyltransferase